MTNKNIRALLLHSNKISLAQLLLSELYNIILIAIVIHLPISTIVRTLTNVDPQNIKYRLMMS